MSALRTRWAALGAAVAVALGGGGIGLVAATDPPEAVTFVPVTACRVVDTRPAFQVGDRMTPLGANDTLVVDATGAAGECPNVVPAGASAVSLNVTSLGATLGTFLTIWETGETQPNASSLNPAPGQPPTPNAVTTGINGNGEFSIFNLQGSVHVFADINGYYVDHDHPHHHDDRYYTETEVDDLIDALPAAQPRSVTLHPAGWSMSNGAFFARENNEQGLHLPKFESVVNPQARFHVTLPSDFTTGTEPILDVYWQISTTGCSVHFEMMPTDLSRVGEVNLSMGAEDIPYVVIGTIAANEVRRESMRLTRASGLRANDVIELVVFRGPDSCDAPVIIKGAHVRYS